MNFRESVVHEPLEMEFLYSILETIESLEVNGWAPRFEELLPPKNKMVPSCREPPKLELKSLSSTLKYAFLGNHETFSVVISSSLESNE